MVKNADSSPSTSDPPLVCVFARAPVPGRTKTRLAAEVGAEFAAALSVTMLLDVIDSLTAGDLEVAVAVADADDAGAVGALLPPEVALLTQPEGDLGERMAGMLALLITEHRRPVALVGSDALLVAPEHVRQAGRALASGAAAAICPAGDGGYSLIAAAAPPEALFRDVPWGTAAVTAVTRERARAAGLRLDELDPLDDVDTAEDLAHVARGSASASAGTRALRTRHVLAGLWPAGAQAASAARRARSG